MRRLWMHVIAASLPAIGIDAASGHQTLEMIVRPDASGRLDAASQDAGPQLCRLLRRGREEWCGTLRMDGDLWIVHSDHGDDEPIRFLQLKTLRPGDHINLRNPGGKQVGFRIEHVRRPLPLPKPSLACRQSRQAHAWAGWQNSPESSGRPVSLAEPQQERSRTGRSPGPGRSEKIFNLNELWCRWQNRNVPLACPGKRHCLGQPEILLARFALAKEKLRCSTCGRVASSFHWRTEALLRAGRFRRE